MELFGVGPLELLFIFIIALILLGPQDMVKVGRNIGLFMRKTFLSPTWLKIQREARNLPYQMMREAGLEENDFRIQSNQLDKRPTSPRFTDSAPPTAKQIESTPVLSASIEGKMPSIPPEWLGLSSSVSSPSVWMKVPSETLSLEDWTNAPKAIASDREIPVDEDIE